MMLAYGLFMTGIVVKATAPGPAAPAPGLFMMLADGLFMTGVVVKAAASGSAAPTPAWTSHTVDDDAAAAWTNKAALR